MLQDGILIEADDRHFVWMLGGPAPSAELQLAPGGIDQPGVLEMLRRLAAELRAACGGGSWMIVVDREVVGLCSYKRAPDADGTLEIGYGVASSRRNRSHATRAIAALLRIAAGNSSVRRVVAETSVTNVASQRVLESNAFVRVGCHTDPEDGELALWRRDVGSSVA